MAILIPEVLLSIKYGYNIVAVVIGTVDNTGTGIMIPSVKKARAGWAEAFKKVAGSADDELIEMPESEWDDTEWFW